MRRALIVTCLISACSDPGSNGGTTTTPALQPPGPTGTTPPSPAPTPTPPPAPAPAPSADPATYPDEIRVERGATPPPADQGWIDLLRAGLPEGEQIPTDRGYRVRVVNNDLAGVPYVQLQLLPDQDETGASGHSYVTNVDLHHAGGAWHYLHFVLEPGAPFGLWRCTAEQEREILQVAHAERPPLFSRCRSLLPELAAGLLAPMEQERLEMRVRNFIQHLGRLETPNEGYVIALRRNEVPRNVEYERGRAFVPFVVQRRSDAVVASGMFVKRGEWSRFELRAEGTEVTITREPIARGFVGTP